MKTPLFILSLTLFFYAGHSQNYNIRELTFKSDSILLYADVFIPLTPNTKQTGIALVQGSGNSDRTNSWTRAFAEALVQAGYYVLVPDKRGTGKSGGDWKSASFSALAEDAVFSARHLKKAYQLNKVGIMGLSQGGQFAPVVGVKDSSIDFIIDVVGAAVTLEEQIIHEVTNTAIKEGLKPNEIQQVLDLHVMMKNYAVTKDWAPLGKRFDELKTSSWSKFAATFPSKPNLWVWNWILLNLNFDPIPYWKQLKQPAFIAYGAKDEQDNVPVYQSVYRLQTAFHQVNKNNYVIKVYNTGHAMYEDDKGEIRKEFLDDLFAWLKTM